MTLGRALAVFALVCLMIAPTRAQELAATATGEARLTQTGELVLHGTLLERRGTLMVAPRIVGTQVTGEWSVTFEQEVTDGHTVETGALSGRITDGVALRGPDGGVLALRDLKLNIVDGSGEHVGVTGGTGLLELQLGSVSQPFHARLNLSF